MNNLTLDELLSLCIANQPGSEGYDLVEFDQYLAELIKRWHSHLLGELKSKLNSPELACKEKCGMYGEHIDEDKIKIEKFLGSLNNISGVKTRAYLTNEIRLINEKIFGI